MMKTRRKSKAAAAAAAASEQETDATATEEFQPLTVHLPEDIDSEVLSNLVPAQATEVDSIQRSLDEARAEAGKREVELDQALQDRESIAKDFEASLEGLHKELTEVKHDKEGLAKSNSALQAQIASLSVSQASSSTETETLRHRVEDTEREKRDLVCVVSRLKQENSQQEEEVQTLRANLKEARQEHQSLESTVRELRSIETSTKFRLETLTQQLELAQSEAERANNELSAKSEEFANHRRTKHAEIVALQASYDSLNQTHSSTQATLKALQSSHTTQTHQLTQALARVQDLTGKLAEQEATYASEANGLRRLITMMEEREKQAKDIVESIEREWAGVGEKAERRESALKEEMEREKKGRELAEKKVEQLEAVLDQVGRGDLPLPGGASGPSMPLRTPASVADPLTQGMMGLSPTVAMASKAQRSGKTFTEVYADYVRLQEDYAKKLSEYEHMDRTLTAVLAQIEERAPILSQQRAEYERLQSEAAQLASQLAQALAERDTQVNLAQETSQKLSTVDRENGLLQKQLADLGRQVQLLLKEIARRDDPAMPSDEELDQMAPLDPAENIEDVITNHLVVFRSIGGLQEQNQKLLRIVRELGDKLESEEREYREAMEKEQGEAVREAHEAIQELAAQLERQKKSSEGIIQAYVKERDTLRSMLAKAEARVTGIPNGDVHGHVTDGTNTMFGESSDLAKELAEVQSQFDAYRTEMGVDSVRLREDLLQSQKEVNRLGAELAKANAKLEYMADRQRMNQEQFALHNRELDELTKRNQRLYDQWTRIDIECARVVEDLQIANGHVEKLRNECANLKAEKKIWESVQARLVEENKTLATERAHLSDLMTNVQKMHNDLERSGENDRRRLESQLQMIESQAQDLRAQISKERDQIRHITLQKDLELKELHNRLDKAADELSKTRESLVGAETSKKHLEERVEDLVKQLKGNEEKLAVYERRTILPGGTTQTVEQDVDHEQQLETEVAELRSALKIAEVDLATARSHVQQFQEISQANEAALAALNTTHDEYKSSMEGHIAKQESEYKAIEDKLKLAEEELQQLAVKNTELQKTFDSEKVAWLNDKKTLEDTIVDLSTTEKNSESDRTARENELRQQQGRAKAAEERYSQEVLAHAEAIKRIDSLKRQVNTLQTTSREQSTVAQTAQAKLTASEESWKQQKEALGKEITTLKDRCQDLLSQNSILHQHLETVSSQAARIRQTADSTSSSTGDAESTDDVDTKLSELRSVVAYLRKEKEIVDLQLELSKQETVRLKAQVEHLSQNLEETRKTLSEERQRAMESAASSAQHAELLERINQLNILRESNSTLRSDCDAHAKRARDLESKLRQLTSQLEPAKEQARVAQAELEARDAQLKRLEEENRKWQERNTQLLTKYDRIDPSEVQGLKDEIEQLKSQKAELEAANTEGEQQIATHSQRIEQLENAIRTHKETFAKNMNGFRAKLGAANNERTTLMERIKALENEVTTLQTQTNTVKAVQGQPSSEEAQKQAELIASLRAERDKLVEEKASLIGSTPPTSDAAAKEHQLADAERTELTKARDEALAKVKETSEQVQKFQEEITSIRRSNEKFQIRIQDLTRARAADSEKAMAQQTAAVAAAVEKTKGEMQALNNEGIADDLGRRHSEELKALEERLTAKHQEELKTALDAARVSQEKPTSANVDLDKAISEAVATRETELKSGFAKELEEAVERGRAEVGMKMKLKDAQLVKSQKRVKDMESQILEWKKAGLLPETAAATAPPTMPISTTANANAIASTSQAPSASTPASTTKAPPKTPQTPVSTISAVPSTPSAPTPASLPRKPPTGPAEAIGPGSGRGRGTLRGAGRGVARGLNIRGAAPGGTSTTHSPPTAPSGGVSIMGAAAKRPREEGDPVTADDSLAKRIKPAEAGKPVVLRRPPPS